MNGLGETLVLLSVLCVSASSIPKLSDEVGWVHTTIMATVSCGVTLAAVARQSIHDAVQLVWQLLCGWVRERLHEGG